MLHLFSIPAILLGIVSTLIVISTSKEIRTAWNSMRIWIKLWKNGERKLGNWCPPQDFVLVLTRSIINYLTLALVGVIVELLLK